MHVKRNLSLIIKFLIRIFFNEKLNNLFFYKTIEKKLKSELQTNLQKAAIDCFNEGLITKAQKLNYFISSEFFFHYNHCKHPKSNT